MSTAFYSKTDEQLKRLNQIIKQYLRVYVSIEQSD